MQIVFLISIIIRQVHCYSCEKFGPKCISCDEFKRILWNDQIKQDNIGNILADDSCPNCDTRTCHLCNVTNSTLCMFCTDSFTLDKNNESKTYKKCITCPKNCFSCYENDENKCTSCQYVYGFVAPLHGYEKCAKCSDPYCYDCDDDYKVCTKCHDGYGLKQSITGIYSCEKCDSLHCLRCATDSRICTKCEDGYNTQNGECVKCPDNCLSCDFSRGTVCTECSNGCNDGYSFNGNTCIKCKDSKCINCNDDVNNCEDCTKGYGLIIVGDNLACAKCEDPNSVTCPVYNISSSCKTGYGKNGFKCSKCKDENCLKCNLIYTSCEICKEGFRENIYGKCTKCKLDNCKKCDEDECNCEECMDGYGFDDNYNSETKGQCIKCSVSNCATCNSHGECKKCLENYDLDKREGNALKTKMQVIMMIAKKITKISYLKKLFIL